jgi:DNA polymerase V
MDKVFAMVDCNSFFCSCERLFNPLLKNRPVIVLSNNDGCAVARTPEAKALGIKMGEPYFKIRELCQKHNVAVFSSNFSLYTDISRRVMHVLAGLGLAIEVYSVDEAWLDITNVTTDYHTYGKMIKETVEREVGIPVGVGIASTKTLSKLANHIAKNSSRAEGVVDLTNSLHWQAALKRVEIADVWGIGRQSARKLHELKIATAYDFVQYNNDVKIQNLLTKSGLQRKLELQGIRCFDLECVPAKKKAIRSSRTFGSPLYQKEDLQEAIANYVSAAAAKLRAQQSLCLELYVFIHTSPHKNVPQYYGQQSLRLKSPTADTRKLIVTAWKVLDQIYKGGFEYKKAGVELHHFVDAHQEQLDLFVKSDSARDEKLMQMLDSVNEVQGELVVKSMACGVDNQAWQMLRDYKSARFTTSWYELPKVK